MYFNAALLSLVVPACGAVHEALSDIPFGWTRSPATMSESTPMRLQATLQYRNLDKLQSLLASTSRPGSKSYGHYLDLANQTSIFGPSGQSESEVEAWPLRSGANNIRTDGGSVSYKPDPRSNSSISFGNFLNGSARYADLATFEKAFEIPSQNFTNVALINGGVDDQNPPTQEDGEADLDVQDIVGLVGGLPVYPYITGGSPPYIPDLAGPSQANNSNEPFLPFYQYLISQNNSNLPHVITSSHGDRENTVPVKYAQRVCNMIAMLGLRGRTVLHSSGDEGLGGVCRNNVGLKQPQFTAQFPATCPYVTAVVGTQFLDPVVGWNASSGGFSFYFDQPWYQKQSIDTYLTKYIKPSAKNIHSSNNYTDFSGRGFPDISAHSLYPFYLIYMNGSAHGSGGTSASVPVIASIFALLNDARFRAGWPAIGFANPWLYGTGQAVLNDITLGSAVGCTGSNFQTGKSIPGAGVIPCATWNATVGWDPVTGLGTPDFQKLKQLALDAPSS